MKSFGRTDTSTPNRVGFETVPKTGFIFKKIIVASPFGQSYQIGLDGIVNTSATNVNSVAIIDAAGVETNLQIEYSNTLPDILEQGKCYICTKYGFDSTIYFTQGYVNYTAKYKFGLTASVITVDMFNAMLPVAKIFTKLIPTEFSPYEKLCNGQNINPNVYSIYTEEISKIESFRDILWFDDGTIKVPDYDLAVMLLSKTGVTFDNAPIGIKNPKSYVPKVAFRDKPHSHTATVGNWDNKPRYNDLGRPNAGTRSKTITTNYVTTEPDFNNPVIQNPGLTEIHDHIVMPPNIPLYPFIIVR